MLQHERDFDQTRQKTTPFSVADVGLYTPYPVTYVSEDDS